LAHAGGGAGYAGKGNDPFIGITSNTYGDGALTNLIGGSGGGGGDYPGGAGGGAVELLAHGDGDLTLTSAAKILANGGDASRVHAKSGGGGSGGAIKLSGGSVSIVVEYRFKRMAIWYSVLLP
jgi:hypothetical protein